MSQPRIETLLGDRYRILGTIRNGGMGTVFLAEDIRLPGARCAVKILNEDCAARFDDEVRALASLNHPCVPRIRDVGRDGTPYLVMDYVEGRSLDQIGSPMPVAEVADVVLQVLDVLAYLHGQSPPVVHRDIKPANLIREAHTDRIVLVDFGVARGVRPEAASTQTTVGTLEFAALEQVQGHAEPRSDLYSLGATALALMTARTPAPLDETPTAELCAGLDAGFAEIIDRSRALNVQHRYGNAEAMREAIVRWRDGASPRPTAPLVWKPPAARRRLAWLPILVSLLVVLIGFRLLSAGRVDHEEDGPPRWIPMPPDGWQYTSLGMCHAGDVEVPIDRYRLVHVGHPRQRAFIIAYHTAKGESEADLKARAPEVRQVLSTAFLAPPIHFDDASDGTFRFTSGSTAGEGRFVYKRLGHGGLRAFLLFFPTQTADELKETRVVMLGMLPPEDVY